MSIALTAAALALSSAVLAAPTAGTPSAGCQAPLVRAELEAVEDTVRAMSEQYVKYEYRIPMRDGVKLYTVAYVPRDRSRTWPVLLMRTPYSVVYGVDNYPDPKSRRVVSRFAPSRHFVRDGFIFVHQDVRGRMMSEGEFVDIRPRAGQSDSAGGKGPRIDEATDAYDTIDFLVKNVPANNGKVGLWGISYPGFYAAQAAIDAHPALKAVSPQAPVTDWFLGDDFHHNGALFLEAAFSFHASFGKPRPKPNRQWTWGFDYQAGDAYEFFLELGPLSNANARHLKGEIAFWNDMMAHGTYDAFWKARNPLPHYRNTKPAVLTVGGLFDAEDLWGTLATYRAFETQSPGADVRLVLGPWAHGGWGRTEGDRLGDISFRWKTSPWFQEHIALPFFQHYLKGCAEKEAAEAWVFETGTNLFQRYDRWPPKEAKPTSLFLAPGEALSLTPPSGEGFEEWVSDPAKPVPHQTKLALEDDGEYMIADQRFAARRPDVMVHATPPLAEDVTLAGPLEANLFVSTTGTDADFVVKLIDVSPADRGDPDPNPTGVRLAGYQQLVRAEVFRGRFRNSFEKPEPFVPNQVTKLRFTLPDVHHTFRTGHRLMVQVQSSWFPLVDRNPQTFVELATAKASDFQAARHRLYFARGQASSLTVPLLRGALKFLPKD